MPLTQRMLATAVFTLSLPLAAQGYKVVDHWKIGGQGGWDYLLSDDANHRLYITHNATVEVVDTATGHRIGAVTGFKSTHGVALNPDGKTGYISDGAGNAVAMFDRSTLKVVKTVAAGSNPDGIAFEPTTSTVWAFNGRSNDVTVIDAKTDAVVATIKLPGKPEFPQVDGKGHVFVNIEDRNAIAAFSAAAKKQTGLWKLDGCDSPSGMALDRNRHLLFSVCDGKKMAVVDYVSGRTLGLANIGDSPDAAGFDSKTGLAFSSNGDGTLSVLDTSKPGFPTVQTVQTAKGARTMAFDAITGTIYLSAAKYAAAPAASADKPKPRPPVVSDTFEVLVVSK